MEQVKARLKKETEKPHNSERSKEWPPTKEGNVYLADYTNHVIWKVDEEFNATIFAGVPGESGYKDGKPQEALFNKPYDVAATPDGILYVADTYNYLIRCIAIQ